MLRHLLAVALLVAAMCSPVAAQTAMKADAAYGVRYVEERVVELPGDQLKPYLTVFGEKGDPKMAAMVKWFETNDTLKGIKDQTHFLVMYTDDPMYHRYAGNVPALPYVCLQAVNVEKPIAEYAGSQVPMTADALARGLNVTASKAECFRRRNQVQPQPGPGPGPYIDPAPQPLPPTPGPPSRPTPRFPWFLLILIVTLSAAGGAGREWYKTYYSK